MRLSKSKINIAFLVYIFLSNCDMVCKCHNQKDKLQTITAANNIFYCKLSGKVFLNGHFYFGSRNSTLMPDFLINFLIFFTNFLKFLKVSQLLLVLQVAAFPLLIAVFIYSLLTAFKEK